MSADHPSDGRFHPGCPVCAALGRKPPTDAPPATATTAVRVTDVNGATLGYLEPPTDPLPDEPRLELGEIRIVDALDASYHPIADHDLGARWRAVADEERAARAEALARGEVPEA